MTSRLLRVYIAFWHRIHNSTVLVKFRSVTLKSWFLGKFLTCQSNRIKEFIFNTGQRNAGNASFWCVWCPWRAVIIYRQVIHLIVCLPILINKPFLVFWPRLYELVCREILNWFYDKHTHSWHWHPSRDYDTRAASTKG